MSIDGCTGCRPRKRQRTARNAGLDVPRVSAALHRHGYAVVTLASAGEADKVVVAAARYFRQAAHVKQQPQKRSSSSSTSNWGYRRATQHDGCGGGGSCSGDSIASAAASRFELFRIRRGPTCPWSKASAHLLPPAYALLQLLEQVSKAILSAVIPSPPPSLDGSGGGAGGGAGATAGAAATGSAPRLDDMMAAYQNTSHLAAGSYCESHLDLLSPVGACVGAWDTIVGGSFVTIMPLTATTRQLQVYDHHRSEWVPVAGNAPSKGSLPGTSLLVLAGTALEAVTMGRYPAGRVRVAAPQLLLLHERMPESEQETAWVRQCQQQQQQSPKYTQQQHNDTTTAATTTPTPRQPPSYMQRLPIDCTDVTCLTPWSDTLVACLARHSFAIVRLIDDKAVADLQATAKAAAAFFSTVPLAEKRATQRLYAEPKAHATATATAAKSLWGYSEPTNAKQLFRARRGPACPWPRKPPQFGVIAMRAMCHLEAVTTACLAALLPTLRATATVPATVAALAAAGTNIEHLSPGAWLRSPLDLFHYHNRWSAATAAPTATGADPGVHAGASSPTASMPSPNCLPHVDRGLLACVPVAAVAGLMMRDRDTRRWVDVEAAPEVAALPFRDVVVFVGQELQEASKGRFQACVHMVRGNKAAGPRLSLVYERRIEASEEAQQLFVRLDST